MYVGGIMTENSVLIHKWELFRFTLKVVLTWSEFVLLEFDSCHGHIDLC